MDYVIKTTIKVDPNEFDRVEQKVRDILQSKGFGILTEIDVKETLKKKLDIDRAPYKILGACNPPRANKAIEAEADIGVLLPCNVIIYVQNNEIVVSAMNPASALGLIGNPIVDEVGKEVEEIMKDVIKEVEEIFKN